MPKGILMSLLIIVILLIAGISVVMFASNDENTNNNSDNPDTNVTQTLQVAAVLPTSDVVTINASEYDSIEGELKVVDESSSENGKCLFLEDTVLGKPAVLSAKVTYKFKVEKAGEYKIWIRHFWQDECGNSLFVVVDGGEQMLFGDDGTVNIWRWPPALRLKVDLTEGEHTLEIIPREDGLKFDQIILTTDDDYYPSPAKKK